jgi:hypothetical protein
VERIDRVQLPELMPLTAFLVAVTYIPGVPSATLVGRWWVMAIGAALLLYRTPRLCLTSAHWVGATLLLWCVASVLWSWSRWDTLGGLVHLLVLAGVFCVAAEREGLLSGMVAFGLGLVPSAAIAVGQQLGWQPVLNISDHPVGLFLSKNAATEAALPVLVWLVTSIFETRMRDWSPERVTGMVLLLPPVMLIALLPQAKETWLMMFGAVFAVVLYWARECDRREFGGGGHYTAGVLCIVVGLVILVVVVAATWPEESTWTFNERLAIWQVTLAAWWLSPVLGYGFGTFPALLNGLEYAHNDYLQFLFEIGPVGLALVVAFFITVLVPWRHDLASKVGLASLLVSALVWWPLQSPASGFLVALLAGDLVGAGRRARVHESESRATGGEGLRPKRGHSAGAVSDVASGWHALAFRS